MTVPPELPTALALAASIGSVAYTVSSSKVSAPLRTHVMKRAIRDRSKGWRWLADLLSCPYCVSHWLAFAATLIYRPWLVDSRLSKAVAPGWVGRVFDFAVTSMALVTLAMLAVWLIKRALAPVASPAAPAPEPSAAERLNRSSVERFRQRTEQPGHISPRGAAPTDTQVVGGQPGPVTRPRHVRPDETMVDGMPPVASPGPEQQPTPDPAAETQVLGAVPSPPNPDRT